MNTVPGGRGRGFEGGQPGESRLTWIARWIALALCGVLAATGCARRDRTPDPPKAVEPQRGGTLRVLQESTASLDPISVDDLYEASVIDRIFEGLVRLDPETGVQPELAESWVISEDGRLYRFTLRQGVRFHDGSAVTAEDVVRSLARALDPHKKAPCLAETYLLGIEGAKEFAAGRARNISGLWAADDRTVMIRLTEPLSFFLSVLAMDQLKVIPARATEESLQERPVGTGPFRFVSRQGGESIVLARNDGYWGRPALVDTLCFTAATHLTPEESVARLIRGEVNVISLPRAHRSLLEEVAGYRVLRSPDLTVTFLGINTHTPPLDQLAVRQAIAMALDRQGLIPPGAKDRDAATGVLPPRLAGYTPEPKILPYDPVEARTRLALAGFDERRPLPAVDFYTTPSNAEWLVGALERQLAAVGVTLRTHVVSWPELDGRITRGQAPLFTLSWQADLPDPDSFLYFLFRTGESCNLFSFSDAKVDSLLTLGRRMAPGPARYAVYRQIEERVLQFAPMIPLYHAATLYAWDPALQGVELSQFGFAQVRFERIWFRPPALAQETEAAAP